MILVMGPMGAIMHMVMGGMAVSWGFNVVRVVTVRGEMTAFMMSGERFASGREGIGKSSSYSIASFLLGRALGRMQGKMGWKMGRFMMGIWAILGRSMEWKMERFMMTFPGME